MSLPTYWYLGRLWVKEKLDCFVLTTYALVYSKYNATEHAWGAHLTRALPYVTLPNTLPGKTKPPCQQGGLSAAAGEKKRDSDILIMLYNCWRNTGISCNMRDTKSFIMLHRVRITCLFSVKDETYRFLMKVAIKGIPNYKDTMMKSSQIQFYKCEDDYCNNCKNNPIR